MGDDEVAALAERARRAHRLVSDQARRAYVLEITGTPKAGKSSTIRRLATFFKDCGWRVHVVRERAELCPLPMKGHFFFNTWTTSNMLCEVLEVVDGPFDLVVLDRGFLDALVWLEFQRAQRQVTDEEASRFSAFVLLDRWRQLVDATALLLVDPEKALEREQHGRLLPRRGSLMNPEALERFNSAVTRACEAYGDSFALFELSTSELSPEKVAISLASTVLDRVEVWADPMVAALPRAWVEQRFANGHVGWRIEEEAALNSAVTWEKRSLAEETDNIVQLVTCGVYYRDGGVFVFDRQRDEKRLGEYGRHSVWSGQHVEAHADHDAFRRAVACLRARMRTNLHLNVEFDPQPLGMVWTPDDGNPRQQRHMGLFFTVPIEDETVAQSLEDKAFKTAGRGHPLTSRFMQLPELDELELEPWSRKLLDTTWLK